MAEQAGENPSWPALQAVAVRRDREKERLEAIREDLAEWINSLLGTTLDERNLMNDLADGVILCDLAILIEGAAAADEKRIFAQTSTGGRSLWRGLKFYVGEGVEKLRPNRRARAFSFLARDNVAKFLRWCEKLGLPKVLAFESNDLVEERNERPVLHCLLEIGRLAAQTGLATPMLVSMEMEMEEMGTDEPEADGAHMEGIGEEESVDLESDSHGSLSHLESLPEVESETHLAPSSPAPPPPLLAGLGLGVADGRVPDWCLTASEGCASDARLDGPRAWTCTRETGCWLMVDLQSPHRLTGLQLQGDPAGPARVLRLEVLGSIDGEHWDVVSLDQAVLAADVSLYPLPVTRPTGVRFVKVCPQQVVSRVALRLELFGFPLGSLLGLADGSLLDSRLSFTPSLLSGPPLSPRLFSLPGWSFGAPIEVDLAHAHHVTGFLWRGEGAGVTVQSSLDGAHWSDPLPLFGDTNVTAASGGDDESAAAAAIGDRSSVQLVELPTPLPAAFLRLIPGPTSDAAANAGFQFEVLVDRLGSPLGLQSREHCDSFLWASSELPEAPARAARLHVGAGWQPTPADPAPALFVDLGRVRSVRALLVQASAAGSISLAASMGDAVWTPLTESPIALAAADIADARVFCVVLPAPVCAARLRVTPLMQARICVDVLVDDVGLPLGLGVPLSPGAPPPVPDAAFSSSSHKPSSPAHHARLFQAGCWQPQLSDDSPYLQIELDAIQAVRTVLLQCAPGECHFTLAGSIDGLFWEPYRPGQREHLFTRTVTDDTATHAFVLPVPFVARLVRLYFHPWHDDLWARVELLVNNAGQFLGLSDGRVSAAAITATSALDLTHAPTLARLGGMGGWQPAAADAAPAITVDAGHVVRIFGVVTQASQDHTPHDAATQQLRAEVSVDGTWWTRIPTAVLLRGTTAPSATLFARPVVARFLRLSVAPSVCLRFEILSQQVGAIFPSVSDVEAASRRASLAGATAAALSLEHDGYATAASSTTTDPDVGSASTSSAREDKDVAWKSPASMPLTTSSQNSGCDARDAVLLGTGRAWQPSPEDAHPFVQITLAEPLAVHAVVLRGTATAVALLFSFDGITWTDYCYQGRPAHLPGPSGSWIAISISDPFICSHLRIVPLTWLPKTQPSLAAAVCVLACGQPLGLATGHFPDSQIKFSSTFPPPPDATSTHPLSCRLLGDAAWVPAAPRPGEYIELQLGGVYSVHAIAVQGEGPRASAPVAAEVTAGVTSLELRTDIDKSEFPTGSGPLACPAFATGASVVLPRPLVGTAVRVCALSWDHHIALRFELFVSKLGTPVGLQTARIPDAALTSNSARVDAPAAAARLEGEGGWAAAAADGSAHLQVDLGREALVSAVLVQGHEALQAWSTALCVHTSIDGRLWEGSGQNGAAQVVPANVDAGSVACCPVSPRRRARFVRVTPQAWQLAPALRLEVLCADGPTREPSPTLDTAAALSELEVEAARLCNLVGTSTLQLATLHREFSKSSLTRPDLAAVLEQLRAAATETHLRGLGQLQALQTLPETSEGRDGLAAGVLDCIDDLEQRTGSLMEILRSIAEHFDDVQNDLARALCVPAEMQGDVLLGNLQHRIDEVMALQAAAKAPPAVVAAASLKMDQLKTNLHTVLTERSRSLGNLATLDTELTAGMAREQQAVSNLIMEICGHVTQLQRGMKIEPTEKAFAFPSPKPKLVSRASHFRLDMSHVAAKIDSYNKHYLQCVVRLRRLSTQPMAPKQRVALPNFNHVKAKVDSHGYVPRHSPRTRVVRHAPLDLSNVKSKVDSRAPSAAAAAGFRRTASEASISPPRPLTSRTSENVLQTRRGSPHMAKPLVPYADPVDQAIERAVLTCTCKPPLRVTRISQGKYVFHEADADRTVFIRVLRDHVMVRIGGGWDTFEAYLEKIDPCQRERTAGSPATARSPSKGSPVKEFASSAQTVAAAVPAVTPPASAAAAAPAPPLPAPNAGAGVPLSASRSPMGQHAPSAGSPLPRATTVAFGRSSSFSPQPSPTAARAGATATAARPSQSTKASPLTRTKSMLPRPAQRTPTSTPEPGTRRTTSSPSMNP